MECHELSHHELQQACVERRRGQQVVQIGQSVMNPHRFGGAIACECVVGLYFCTLDQVPAVIVITNADVRMVRNLNSVNPNLATGHAVIPDTTLQSWSAGAWNLIKLGRVATYGNRPIWQEARVSDGSQTDSQLSTCPACCGTAVALLPFSVTSVVPMRFARAVVFVDRRH